MTAQDEMAFERDLQAMRRAWSELDAVEPPALLDQAVLNSARRAVGLARPRSGRIGRWSGGLAATAVVVLAVTLVVQQERVDTPATPEAVPPDLEPTGQTATQRALQVAPEALSADAELFELDDAAAPEPDALIERLRNLQAAGNLEVFRAERDAFQATYPDYVLPPDLQADLRPDPRD